MALFGRGSKRPPIAPTGVPFDLAAAQEEVAYGTRPGIVNDGVSYWVIHAIIHELGQPQYLEGEGLAGAAQVRAILDQMRERHGSKPARQNDLNFDNVCGLWAVQGKGQTWIEMLMVHHPRTIGVRGELEASMRAAGLEPPDFR